MSGGAQTQIADCVNPYAIIAIYKYTFPTHHSEYLFIYTYITRTHTIVSLASS